jgi:hypothetical protein
MSSGIASFFAIFFEGIHSFYRLERGRNAWDSYGSIEAAEISAIRSDPPRGHAVHFASLILQVPFADP